MIGFKGERGYSAYEVAVQNGFVGSVQSWLAQLGTSSVYEQKSVTKQTTVENQKEMELPSEYISGAILMVYKDGLKLSETEYSIDENSGKIVFKKPIAEVGTSVEMCVTTMNTTDLPIVTEVNSASTNETAPSSRCVYNIKTVIERQMEKDRESVNAVKVPTGGTTGQVLAKKSDVDNDVEWKDLALFDRVYPVGSVYISVSSTNPSNLFGGSWKQIQDTFLLAAGSKYTAGTTGGEEKHKLTVEEMPSHVHTGLPDIIIEDGFTSGSYGYKSNGSNPKATNIAGGDRAHNNMPPYLTVYMWQRIS